MLLVLKKKKSTGSSGDYPKKRTAKRTAAFKLHRFLGGVLEGEEAVGLEGKERACAKSMLRPVIDRLAKICGLGE